MWLGKGYDPEGMIQPLPPAGDAKWKKWSKKGYAEGKVSDWDVLKAVKVASKAAPVKVS